MRQISSNNVVVLTGRGQVAPAPIMIEPTTRLLMTDQAAEVLGLKPSTLEKLRSLGGGPAFLKLGRSVRYAPADLQVWVDARRRQHTGQSKVA